MLYLHLALKLVTVLNLCSALYFRTYICVYAKSLPARVEFTFTRIFGHISEAAITMCGNPTKVFSTDSSAQLTFRFT